MQDKHWPNILQIIFPAFNVFGSFSLFFRICLYYPRMPLCACVSLDVSSFLVFPYLTCVACLSHPSRLQALLLAILSQPTSPILSLNTRILYFCWSALHIAITLANQPACWLFLFFQELSLRDPSLHVHFSPELLLSTHIACSKLLFCVLSFLFLCKHLAPHSVGASLAGVLPLTLYIKHLDQELNTIGSQEIFIDYNMSITPLKSIF